jgi:hypothetical protein
MYDHTTIMVTIIAFAVGSAVLMYRNQIARHLARHSLLEPLRWIFGETAWIKREEERAEKFGGMIFLPVVAVFCFLIVILFIASIVW